MHWNFVDDRVDRRTRPGCCWWAYGSCDSGSDGHVLSWNRPASFMSCFKRSEDQRSSQTRSRLPLLDRDCEFESEDKKVKFESSPAREGVRFEKATSALVRQASNLAAKAQKQQQLRMSREKNKNSSWNILRRGSSADCKNSSIAPPTAGSASTGAAKPRQFGSLSGSSVSPKLSIDNAKKHLLHFRRQTTTEASSIHSHYAGGGGRPGGGRMSIVAKDWDDVHKVHDPESAVGGVYIGDDDVNATRRASLKNKKFVNGKKMNSEFQGAFTAMKISESTDNKLAMIDDEQQQQ